MTASAPFDPFATIAALALPGTDWLIAALFVFLRVGAAVSVLPGLGERLLPARLRLAAALAMTAIVLPAVGHTGPALPDAAFGLARIAATETLAGLALGLAIRLLVIALQIAGTIAAQATSLSQFFGGAGAEPQPAMSQVLMFAGIALLMLAGLPHRAAEYLILSYDLLPAGAWPDADALTGWATSRVARAFALAFTLAAPFVVASTVYNLALGAINRAMPTLMVAFVGAPALTLGGLALLALAAPTMLQVWWAAADALLANPARN